MQIIQLKECNCISSDLPTFFELTKQERILCNSILKVGQKWQRLCEFASEMLRNESKRLDFFYCIRGSESTLMEESEDAIDKAPCQ